MSHAQYDVALATSAPKPTKKQLQEFYNPDLLKVPAPVPVRAHQATTNASSHEGGGKEYDPEAGAPILSNSVASSPVPWYKTRNGRIIIIAVAAVVVIAAVVGGAVGGTHKKSHQNANAFISTASEHQGFPTSINNGGTLLTGLGGLTATNSAPSSTPSASANDPAASIASVLASGDQSRQHPVPLATNLP